MQNSPENKATPIHIGNNRRGMLRKIERNRQKKTPLTVNIDSFMLNLINPDEDHEQINKQLMYERVSILSSIRCRNLRNKHNEDRKRERSAIREDTELRLLGPKSNNQQIQNQLKINPEGKNKSLYNIFVCRRTTPTHYSYSRSKTARQYYKSTQKNTSQITSQPKKALMGYQISPRSPMNRKIQLPVD